LDPDRRSSLTQANENDGEDSLSGDYPQEQLERELTAREAERRQALVDDDMPRLAELMRDDLVHIHTTGIVQGKAELLGHAGTFLQFLNVQRGPLTIRAVSPTVAVMTGTMTNTVKRRDHDERVVVESVVTQVWVREADAWRVASFQATRAPAA